MDNMVKEKKILAIIPARGGSKRIPKKNIIPFKGKPMIAWTIEAAIKSKCFDKVLVSTDDEHIAEVGKKYGADVPFLRDKNSDDFSTVSDVIVNEKNRLDDHYDIIVMLMANCPIRDEFDIKKSIYKFVDNNRTFQISCFKYGWMNPWWAHKIDSLGKASPVFNKAILSRSQDLNDLYCPTGAIWIAKNQELDKAKTFYGPDFVMEPIDWKKAVDIDDYEDFEFAEVVFDFLKKK
ncbi:cytidylyltransferase domain-containing protein [Flavivirga spongiicola]|uniref:Acylneuraminate cytidylyltransferase family protein n=1 Tax=Flavivirga spongiicola TaxID=421621 RepID=A0ABU7XSW4_9FLAO|nr:acylneuraminate cytidylyltransferase family protein [Flavivirga sp. MEBiC05379]MDO5978851.1 acylneuraminate cytidylyltransferase family protein [Flavivirga sp. MEBiC05379]